MDSLNENDNDQSLNTWKEGHPLKIIEGPFKGWFCTFKFWKDAGRSAAWVELYNTKWFPIPLPTEPTQMPSQI
jgi:hypothetical protein